MKAEEKQLLLKDLCGRLLCGVKVQAISVYGYTVQVPIDGYCSSNNKFDIDLRWRTLDEFKPYLRPLSSMTEEEKKVVCSMNMISDTELNDRLNYQKMYVQNYTIETFDYFNEHKLDYRGLIPMDLALEAPKDMYEV